MVINVGKTPAWTKGPVSLRGIMHVPQSHRGSWPLLPFLPSSVSKPHAEWPGLGTVPFLNFADSPRKQHFAGCFFYSSFNCFLYSALRLLRGSLYPCEWIGLLPAGWLQARPHRSQPGTAWLLGPAVCALPQQRPWPEPAFGDQGALTI